MYHQDFDDDDPPGDDSRSSSSRKPSMDDEPSISFVKLLICERHIILQEGLNFLVKHSKKYIKNSLKEVCPIGIFPFSDQKNIGLFNTHVMNGNIDVIYGCIIITAEIVQLYVMNEHQNVLVNFRLPATLCNLINGDKITLGDYNGRFQISLNSGTPQIDNRNGEVSNIIKPTTNYSNIGNITPPTPNKINALEKSIENISNAGENALEEFHEADTQTTVNETSDDDSNVSNLESQIKINLFQSPIIPAKCRPPDKSPNNRKKIKLFNSTSNDLMKMNPTTENVDSQNSLADDELPKKNYFYKSSSKKRPRNIPTLALDYASSSFCNNKNTNHEKTKSGFSTNTNMNNLPFEDDKYLENNGINISLLLENGPLKKYQSKYGENNNASDYDAPTQKICINKPDANRSSIDRNENQFKVPTQEAIPEKSFKSYLTNINQNILPRKTPPRTVVKPNVERASISTSELFDVPTQIIVHEKTVVKPPKPNEEQTSISMLDPFDVLTQVIDHEKTVVKPLKPNVEQASISTLDPFDVLTQVIDHEKPVAKLPKPKVKQASISTLDPFDVPTQVIDHEKTDATPLKPKVEQAMTGTSDSYDIPTQIIVCDKTATKPPEPDVEQALIGTLDPFDVLTQIVQEKPTSKPDDKFSEKANPAPEKTSHVEKLNDDVADPYDCPTQVAPIDIHLLHQSIERMDVEKSASPVNVRKKSENQNYYSSTQQLENDLLSQIPTNQNEVFKTPDKKNFESPNRASSPEDPYGHRRVTTPILAQNYIASKDVVLSPMEIETDSDPEELEPITHRRKFPKKKLKLATPEEDSDSILRALHVEVKDILTSKSNASFLAENNYMRNVLSPKERSPCYMNILDASVYSDFQPEITNPHINNFNLRKRRSTIQKPVYKIMLTRFSSKELQKYEKIIHELGGAISKDDGNILVSEKVSRSFKSLKSVSLGIPLVSMTWLTDSHKSGRFLDPVKYIFMNENYQHSNPTINFLRGWTVYTPSNMSMTTSKELDELIKCNGGIHIKIYPEQNVHGIFMDYKINIMYREKIFSVYDKNDNLDIVLPAPQIEVMHFCSMVLKQKLDFPK